ncbi:MAG: thioredoxin [Acholeplasmatales bacterium]|nr:thioredoxin [Acholeplasmatales bacterium]
MVKEINGLKELNEVVNNNKKVLVDVYATWCGPCKMLAPIVNKVSEDVSDLTVVKIDIDENEDIAAKYGVEAIPTLLVFNNGELVNKNVGFIPENKVKELVK